MRLKYSTSSITVSFDLSIVNCIHLHLGCPWHRLGKSLVKTLSALLHTLEDPESAPAAEPVPTVDTMGRDKIEQHCDSTLSVSEVYAKDPSRTPGNIAEELYGSHVSTIPSYTMSALCRDNAEVFQMVSDVVLSTSQPSRPVNPTLAELHPEAISPGPATEGNSATRSPASSSSMPSTISCNASSEIPCRTASRLP